MNNTTINLLQDYLTTHSQESINGIKDSISNIVDFYVRNLCKNDVYDVVKNNIYVNVLSNIDKLENINDYYDCVKRIIRQEIIAYDQDEYIFDNDDYLNYVNDYPIEETINNTDVEYDEDFIIQTLVKLNSQEKMVFLMKYYDDMQPQAIASELNSDVDVIKGIISKASNKIKENDESGVLFNNLKYSLNNLSRKHLNNNAVMSNINVSQRTIQNNIPVSQNSFPWPKITTLLALTAILVLLGSLTGIIKITKSYPVNRVDYVRKITTTYNSDNDVTSTLQEEYENMRIVKSTKETNNDTEIYEYKYDENGSEIECKHTSNGSFYWYKTKYNAVGDIIKRIYYDEYGDETQTDEYLIKYNLNNLRKHTEIVSDGITIQNNDYTYDLKGRLIELDIYDGDDNLKQTSLYEYDGRGNRTFYSFSISDGYNYSVDNVYDKNDVLIESNNYSYGELQSTTYYKDRLREREDRYSSGSLTSYTTYEYDRKGNMILTETYRDNNLTELTKNSYDRNNRLINSYTYDSNGNLKSYQEIEYFNR